MPVFKFKAKKPGGEVYESRRSADDKFALYRDLKTEGHSVISADEIRERSFPVLEYIKNFSSRVSLRDRVIFARNLGAMLEAGLSLSRALTILEKQTKRKSFRKTINELGTAISQGKSLSEALSLRASVFGSLFISMVRSGEESGSLPKSLKTVSEEMNESYMLRKKVRGAMVYPAIIVCVIIAIAMIMLVYVVPNITAVFTDMKVELPWNTRIVIFASELLKNNFILVIIGILLVIVSLGLFRKSKFGRRFTDAALLKTPLIGNLVREVNSARTARTLSSLLEAGVEVLQSLEITAEVVQNTLFKEVLAKAREKIKKGEAMSSVFSENDKLYPIFVAEMIAIGEETGKLGEMLSNTAAYYEGEVDQKTKDLSVVIEPVLMVIIGVAVAFFALSMLAPTYSLVNQI